MKIINIENFNEFINIIEDNTIDYIIINISACWCKPCNLINNKLNDFISNLKFNKYSNSVFLKIEYDLLEEEQEFQTYLKPNKIPYFYIYKDKILITEFQSSNLEIIENTITTEIDENNNKNFNLVDDF